MSRQYLRRATLTVAGNGEAQDLSALHFKFHIQARDLQTPNRATIRIYNLSDTSANRIQKEFTELWLQCGYKDGDFGLIFHGTIVQVRRGRESATDTYVEIIAADGDPQINFANVSVAMAKGTTFKDRVDALSKALGVPQAHVADLPAGALPRGKTMYGSARDHLRDLAFSTDTAWSLQNGQLQIIPIDGYLPTEIVVLNSMTGMIGLPEQTTDGIHIRTLLNPRLKIGGRVRIDNRSVQQATLNLSLDGAAQNGFLPRIADDGLYRICVNEAEGDTRGQPWYNSLTCIAVGDQPTPSLTNRGYS